MHIFVKTMLREYLLCFDEYRSSNPSESLIILVPVTVLNLEFLLRASPLRRS